MTLRLEYEGKIYGMLSVSTQNSEEPFYGTIVYWFRKKSSFSRRHTFWCVVRLASLKLQKLACERLQAQTFAIFNAALRQHALQKAVYAAFIEDLLQFHHSLF